MAIESQLSALAHPGRLAILEWLKAPARNFPPQVHADPVAVGVCGLFIADKLGVTPATASVHLKQLVAAGLVEATRIGKWTYFRRNEPAIAAFAKAAANL